MTARPDYRNRLESFGARAATTADVDEVLSQACRDIADALDVSHVKALQYLPEHTGLLVRAGVGWRDGVVGKAVIPAGVESASGFTLQTGLPTIANDLQTETRFLVPALHRAHGLRSTVNVLIACGDDVFGVLEADNNEPRSFGEEDVQLLSSFANILVLVIAQARLARENRDLLEQKELLLRELSHRTKNNNQTLLAVVDLEYAKAENAASKRTLEAIGNRIRLLAKLEELLSAADYADTINSSVFLTTICKTIYAATALESGEADLKLDLEDGVFSRRHAQSIAIVINEFITNSFKHAGKSGNIVTLSFGDDAAMLDLRDGGPGIPEKVDRGLGMQIIDAAAKRIGAEITWIRGQGAHLRVRIPLRA